MNSSLCGKGLVGLIVMTSVFAFGQAATERRNLTKSVSFPRQETSRRGPTKVWLITRVEASAIYDLWHKRKTGAESVPDHVGAGTLLEFKLLSDAGPQFIVRKPKDPVVKSPIEIDIKFNAREESVDLQTLRIDAQMLVNGTFRGQIDLLPRLKAYVSPSGIVTGPVYVPSGRYRLELALKDKRGGESRGELMITVK